MPWSTNNGNKCNHVASSCWAPVFTHLCGISDSRQIQFPIENVVARICQFSSIRFESARQDLANYKPISPLSSASVSKSTPHIPRCRVRSMDVAKRDVLVEESIEFLFKILPSLEQSPRQLSPFGWNSICCSSFSIYCLTAPPAARLSMLGTDKGN